MHLRFLEYFVILARERHFGRAADACCVTQPTLSAGISALEELLGRRLVWRDRRFVDLTPEGRAVLPWAQRVLADYDGLRHALEAETGPLRGELRLGVIPASMPAVGGFARFIGQKHPGITLSVQSLTSREIQRGLLAYELDAGLTYLSNEPLTHVKSVSLYSERYIFVVHADAQLAQRDRITWADAAAAPLCLLHASMQNRRILDTHLAARGLQVTPRATADSYVALLAMVLGAGLCSILPDSYASLIAADLPLRLVEFDDPAPPNEIGLVVPAQELLSPLSRAALDAALALQASSFFPFRHELDMMI